MSEESDLLETWGRGLREFIGDPIRAYGPDRGWRQLIFIVCFALAILLSFWTPVTLRGVEVGCALVLGSGWLLAIAFWLLATLNFASKAWLGDTTWLEGLGAFVAVAVGSLLAGLVVWLVAGILAFIVSLILEYAPTVITSVIIVFPAAVVLSLLFYFIVGPGIIEAVILLQARQQLDRDRAQVSAWLDPEDQPLRRLGVTPGVPAMQAAPVATNGAELQVKTVCPHCQREYFVANTKLGRRGRCFHCQGTFVIENSPQPERTGALRMNRATDSNQHARSPISKGVNLELHGLPPGMVETMRDLIAAAEGTGGGLEQVIKAYWSRVQAEARRRNYAKVTELWRVLQQQIDAVYDLRKSHGRLQRVATEETLAERELELRMQEVEQKLAAFQTNVPMETRQEAQERKFMKGDVARAYGIEELREWQRLRAEATQEFESDPEMLKRALERIDAVYEAGGPDNQEG